MLNIDHNKYSIKRHFGNALVTYDANSQLQAKLGEQLIAKIKQQKQVFNRAIDLGCGTGKTTLQLRTELGMQELFAIDIAQELLKYFATKSTKNHLVNADFDHLPFVDQAFDLIFSNMTLQWSLAFNHSLHEISRILQPRGLFAAVFPIQPTFHELNYVLKQYTREEYSNHFLTEAEVRDNLMLQKLQIVECSTETITVYFDDLFALLDSLKSIGATHIKDRKFAALRGKNYFLQLDKIYREQFLNEENRIPLTYQIMFLLVSKNV